jgi:hypothetical protein
MLTVSVTGGEVCRWPSSWRLFRCSLDKAQS